MGAALTLVAACGESAQSGSSGATGAAGDDTIVLASVPSEESTDLQSQFDPIIKMLEKETGKKVSFQQATDYAAVIEGQRAGQIDIGVYGPFSYVIAKDGGVPLEPIGAMVDEAGGKPATSRTGSRAPTPASPTSRASRARRSASSTWPRPPVTSTRARASSKRASTRRRA